MLFDFPNVLSKMFVILILSMISAVHCLEPLVKTDINEEIKNIIGKYVAKIPDIKSKYVINDELSKVINHYFKGKITTFPLYKITLTIDRNPVKIPWTLDPVDDNQIDVKSRDDKDVKDGKERVYKVFVPPQARASGKAMSIKPIIKALTAEEATSPKVTTTTETTTVEVLTIKPITIKPTTVEPTTVEPTTAEPTTAEPTTEK